MVIASSIGVCSSAEAKSMHSTTHRIFATDTTTDAPALQAIGAVAAIANGHDIPMSSVIDTCLRAVRSYAIDQLVQDYVVDRDCAKRGIVVSDAEIDNAIATLRTNIAPQTLEQEIAQHHSSMDYVRHAFSQKIKRARLVDDQVPGTKIVHCRAIQIRFAPPRNAGICCRHNKNGSRSPDAY
jgi:hypothetical protein